ncbi:MAG TPA: hypothetical protein VJ301_20090 [Propionibacteriaceae bacterium]|nr:hypothetical protein [Propionibacteriaceae bacterium]
MIRNTRRRHQLRTPVEVTTSVIRKTTPPTTPLDGGLGSTRAATGSSAGTKGVIALSLIALPAQAAGIV